MIIIVSAPSLGLESGQVRQEAIVKNAFWYLFTSQPLSLVFIGQGDLDDSDILSIGEGLQDQLLLVLDKAFDWDEKQWETNPAAVVIEIAPRARFILGPGTKVGNRYFVGPQELLETIPEIESPVFSDLWFKYVFRGNAHLLFPLVTSTSKNTVWADEAELSRNGFYAAVTISGKRYPFQPFDVVDEEEDLCQLTLDIGGKETIVFFYLPQDDDEENLY